MSNLQDLYKAIETLCKNNVPINDSLSKSLDEAEEKIIRDEILPIIGKSIEPTLRQIQRRMVLVVDYDPSKPISVRMTRKDVITDDKETKKYPLLPIDKPVSSKKQKKHIVVNPRSAIRVTLFQRLPQHNLLMPTGIKSVIGMSTPTAARVLKSLSSQKSQRPSILT